MKRSRDADDKRVKSPLFPISVFVSAFLFFGIFTTLEMKLIGNYIDHINLPMSIVIAVVVSWFVFAVGFTLFTRWQINRLYQRPIENFAESARRVANGDFSVYIPPRHTRDKMDYLDVVFMDFNKMVEELGSIETLKTDFFSNVSHEFKTPLSVIQNYAQMLAWESITEEQRQEYANAILQSTRRLSALITNLLKLNKLEKQTIQPQPEPYDLCRQLCDCALGFEAAWDKKNLEFVADVYDSVTIVADENLMEIVWNNLLSNAIKFTEPGGTVTLRQTSTEDTVTVSIRDTGCGMSEETIKHIFDKFYQGDTSHSTEGNGLGLSLALRILQLCGYSVTANSKVGEGSSFEVTIPMTGGQSNE